jgi:broad specificity phosphatase PhoE
MSDVLFYIVRHGTTLLNEEDKYRGWSNDPAADLDAKGIKQGKKAGAFLVKLGDSYGPIVCSGLNRAVHMAALVAGKLKIHDIYKDKRLYPLDTGDLTGESKAEHSIDEYLKDKSKNNQGG